METDKSTLFTLFYDGQCPLCEMEVRHLKRHDHNKLIAYEDIMREDFVERFPDLDWQAMNAKIHGRTADGVWLTGLDVTHHMWSLVGKGWLYAPLRWPVIRWFADRAYMAFARHRHSIARLLTGKARCDSDQCKVEN